MSENAIGPRGERLNRTLGNPPLTVGKERAEVALASRTNNNTLAELSVLDALARLELWHLSHL
jgi:hypothetical protein